MAEDRSEMARRAWHLLMRAAERHMEQWTRELKALGLTGVMGHILDDLAKRPPGPMSQIVAEFGIDPGWVTDVIDKLEARGDVVRKPSVEDRRVKIVELTETGRRTWRQIDDLIASPPSELDRLTDEEVRILLRIAEHFAPEQDRNQAGPGSGQ